MNKSYEGFSIGEVCIFKKTFTTEDFASFSLLSGDVNPLHHDHHYAEQTPFKQIIVPLHLAASPLSAIAGVVFPGERALYLGHDLKALKPIPYQIELTYSSKIIEKIERNNILILNTIVFNEDAIYIEAIQRIQVRDDSAHSDPIDHLQSLYSRFSLINEAVLITGAAGEVGRNVALKQAALGKTLVLSFRKYDARIAALITKLSAFNNDVELLELDLATAGTALISEKISQLNAHVGSVIHCACPAVNHSLSEHMKVNYESLQTIFSVFKHQWLSHQSGNVIFISSSATHYHPEGWENYIAAKSATENYLKGLHQHYAHYGIRTHVLAPGRIDTEFSAPLALEGVESLLAEQVAEEVTAIHENTFHKNIANKSIIHKSIIHKSIVHKNIAHKNMAPFYTWLEVNSKRVGSIGFMDLDVIDTSSSHVTGYEVGCEVGLNGAEKYVSNKNVQADILGKTQFVQRAAVDLSDSLKHFLNRFFKIAEPVDWGNMAINMLSVWNSLRHIELLIALESEFDITVTSTEIDQTKSFKGILHLLNHKRSHFKEIK